jgi:hypothetical protein
MASPSIIPADRLDRDIYLVLEDFRGGAAWRETDEDATDLATVLDDLMSGHYDRPLRILACNPAEGWSRDASEDVAGELEIRINGEGREVSGALCEFIERHLGRPIGVQLALPLRMAHGYARQAGGREGARGAGPLYPLPDLRRDARHARPR